MDDITIDRALVRSLLADQHPDLAGLEIREVDGAVRGAGLTAPGAATRVLLDRVPAVGAGQILLGGVVGSR
jgi:hypothetical protein